MTSVDGDPPQYVAAHLHDRLASDPRIAILDVHVRVVGAKVFVDGTVSTDERRRAVGEIAGELLPQYEIHNQLVVVECPEVDIGEAEHLT